MAWNSIAVGCPELACSDDSETYSGVPVVEIDNVVTENRMNWVETAAVDVVDAMLCITTSSGPAGKVPNGAMSCNRWNIGNTLPLLLVSHTTGGPAGVA